MCFYWRLDLQAIRGGADLGDGLRGGCATVEHHQEQRRDRESSVRGKQGRACAGAETEEDRRVLQGIPSLLDALADTFSPIEQRRRRSKQPLTKPRPALGAHAGQQRRSLLLRERLARESGHQTCSLLRLVHSLGARRALLAVTAQSPGVSLPEGVSQVGLNQPSHKET